MNIHTFGCAACCALAAIASHVPSLQAASLSATNARGGQVVVTHNVGTRTRVYDYAPSIMEDGKYKMWWCGGYNGDYIYYSESVSLGGGWPAGVAVFGPRHSTTQYFDATHTCDPSVVRVNGIYYMYYGGISFGNSAYSPLTRIGVAVSNDGRTWNRAFNGLPIVRPHSDYGCTFRPLKTGEYGAGQPSVVYLNGYFYMSYLDSTGKVSNPVNAAGQYVIRSRDPLFQSDVEVLTSTGFARRNLDCAAGNATSFAFDGISIDWMYSDLIGKFIIASNQEYGKTYLYIRDLARPTEKTTLTVANYWGEGSGLLRRPDGHAVPSRNNIANIPVEIFSPVPTLASGGVDIQSAMNPPAQKGIEYFNGWDIAYKGYDLATGLTDSGLAENGTLIKVLEGYLLEIPYLPFTLVQNQRRLQFALPTPALRLSRNIRNNLTSAQFHMIPYGASLYKGATVLGASGRPGAFLLDNNTLWPVSCPHIITDNGSAITFVSTTAFDSYRVGPALYCL